ncbi:MAG: hypothetical protein RL407_1027 [Bacteroidota bacterium]|jgi:Domain of unknown function (DUF5668)
MKSTKKSRNEGSLVIGLLFLVIGTFLFFRKLGVFIPDWIISWPMVLIALGTYSLIRNEFKGAFGYFFLGLGTYFLLTREFDLDLGIEKFFVPLVFIGMGSYLIFKRNQENKVIEEAQKSWENNRKRKAEQEQVKAIHETKEVQEISAQSITPDPGETSHTGNKEGGYTRATGTTFMDQIRCNAFFSGVKRRLMTKNFEGGKLTAIFGSIDLDLTQVDFSGEVILQVEIGFGGVVLLVPPHWDIRTEVTNIAAGLEDKRLFREGGVDPNKVLVLKGTQIFGGLVIKSF